jgi:hypothetical protein
MCMFEYVYICVCVFAGFLMCACVYVWVFLMCGFVFLCLCVGFVMCGCFVIVYKYTSIFLFGYSDCGFSVFFLSCKANSKVKLANTGRGLHSSILVFLSVFLLLFVLLYVLFVFKCVLYYCHRVATQLHLTTTGSFHKSLQNFQTRLHNNQGRRSRKLRMNR